MAAFAREGDLVLLRAHGLEGLNLRVDLVPKDLVPAGPLPAPPVLLEQQSGAYGPR